MIRQLVLTKIDNDYLLKSLVDEEKSITIKNKTINGEELYSAFYQNINTKIEHKINNDTNNPVEKVIYNQLCDLFNKIDEQVNLIFEDN